MAEIKVGGPKVRTRRKLRNPFAPEIASVGHTLSAESEKKPGADAQKKKKIFVFYSNESSRVRLYFIKAENSEAARHFLEGRLPAENKNFARIEAWTFDDVESGVLYTGYITLDIRILGPHITS